MNAKSAAMAGRSRRTPGKPGRFDPSEPLHMTTRHAKRNGVPNGSPSVNGSVEDDESRRSSLDDLRPTTSYSLGSQTSAKRRRISGTSTNSAPDVNISFESQASAEKSVPIKTKSISPTLQQTSPSRKRKRSTPTPPYTSNVNESVTPPGNTLDYQGARDILETVQFEDLSGGETDGGSGDPGGDFLGVAQSTELTPSGTPAGSEAVSPVSDDSASRGGFPTKHAESALDKALKAAGANDVEMDEAEELAEADEVDDGDDLEDADDAARADDDDRPRRRIAGRRRADHHEADIEALMRRQLQLKSAYRSIARALKPVLAEIAQKTVENLESNPSLHEQVVEYQGTEDMAGIQKTLDDALAKRKAQLDAQYKWSKQLLLEKRDGEVEVRKSRYNLHYEDLRQQSLDRLDHDMLVIARQAQVENGNMNHETEDEDNDVIPMPKRTAYRFVRSNALDAKYDSRSRLALESEKAISHLQKRISMHETLQKYHQDEETTSNGPGFTVMDSGAREAANARHESVVNTNILAEAAAETERISSIPVIPNQQALGLQMLGDLCSRPSIRASVPHATSKPGREPLMEPSTPMQMPPPPIPPPFAYEGPHGSPRGTAPPDQFQSPRPPPQSFMRAEPMMNAPSTEVVMPLSPAFNPHRDISMVSPARKSQHAHGRPRKESNPAPLTPSQGGMTDRSPGRIERFERVHSRSHSTHSASPYSHTRTHSREDPTWEQYHRPLSIDRESRPLHAVERNIHEFSHSGPLSIARVEPVEPVEQKDDDAALPSQPEPVKAASPSDHLLHMRRTPHFEPPSNPGAADSRATVESSPARRDPLRLEELAGLTNAPSPAPGLTPAPGDDSTHDIPNQVETSPRQGGSVQGTEDSQKLEHPPLQDTDAVEDAAQPEQDSQTKDAAQGEDHSVDSSAKKSRSRASSIISQSTGTEATDEASIADSGPRKTRNKGTRSSIGSKTTRGERSGLSRKLFKTGGKRHTIGSPGGPQMHRFRLNTVESTPPQSRWPGAAGAAPPPPPPPHDYYGQPAYAPPPGYGMPFQPPNYQYQYPYDHAQQYQHRDSFPPPPPNGPWPPYPQTQSPLYAVPQGTQPPPGPTGASPEPWPPAMAIDPALMGPGPQSPLMHQPQAPPGYAHPRGAALAPAPPDTRYPQLFPGGPSTHAPAFAQQQRQHEGDNRKKSKSEMRGQTFKHWAPRQPRDRDRESR